MSLLRATDVAVEMAMAMAVSVAVPAVFSVAISLPTDKAFATGPTVGAGGGEFWFVDVDAFDSTFRIKPWIRSSRFWTFCV